MVNKKQLKAQNSFKLKDNIKTYNIATKSHPMLHTRRLLAQLNHHSYPYKNIRKRKIIRRAGKPYKTEVLNLNYSTDLAIQSKGNKEIILIRKQVFLQKEFLFCLLVLYLVKKLGKNSVNLFTE